MTTIDFMDRPIAFHRVFVTMTGSVNAALMLSQAIYWSKRTSDDDGWFYKTAVEWEKETGLTRREQDTARRLLSDVMEEKLAGMPARTYFRVTAPRLREWMVNNARASLAENAKQGCTKAPNKVGGKRQTATNKSTETTTQILAVYDAYPKKVGKPVALRSIAKAVKKFGFEELLAKTQKYAEAVKGTDPQFIPNPATWFNQERFNDDPTTWKRAADKRTDRSSVTNARNSNANAADDYR
jgi:hypothetical protein